MKVWIVQFRSTGEDYEARAFRNKGEAFAFAREFLELFVWEPEAFSTLSDLEAYCFEEDKAYINITYDVI